MFWLACEPECDDVLGNCVLVNLSRAQVGMGILVSEWSSWSEMVAGGGRMKG